MPLFGKRQPATSSGLSFRALGQSGARATRDLETFPSPPGITWITFTCDEVTSFCPVTQQPDFSTVVITYQPDTLCIESKSLKLYLQSFRDEGIFCEGLAQQICNDIVRATRPFEVSVSVHQHKRGGIETTAVAEWSDPTGEA